MLLFLGYASRAVTQSSPQKKFPPPNTAGPVLPPPIEVKSWSRPESGWLYVLDSRPGKAVLPGRVLLIDPDKPEIKGIISAGVNLDFALSPDGARLYVASWGGGAKSNLAEIDTSNGAILRTTEVENRLTANWFPPYSSMDVSGDGLMLRILMYIPTAPEHDSYHLASFNAHTGDELPGRVNLGKCGYARFVNYPATDQFGVVCPTTNRLRRIRVDPGSHALDNSFVIFPWERRLGIAQIIAAPGGQDVTIVRGDGAVYRMDVDSGAVADTPIQGDIQGRIPPASWPESADGKRLYVGYSSFPNRRFYLDFDRSADLSPRRQSVDQIRVLDTANWSDAGRIRTTSPTWSAVTSNDGRSLYAMSPESHSVLVIDTASLQQTRAIPVGGNPALALVAP